MSEEITLTNVNFKEYTIIDNCVCYIDNRITRIGECDFTDPNISYIKIPNSVKSIDNTVSFKYDQFIDIIKPNTNINTISINLLNIQYYRVPDNNNNNIFDRFKYSACKFTDTPKSRDFWV